MGFGAYDSAAALKPEFNVLFDKSGIDKLPEEEKTEIKKTYIMGESSEELWGSLLKLTELIYAELKDYKVPVSQEMIKSYYEGLM